MTEQRPSLSTVGRVTDHSEPHRDGGHSVDPELLRRVADEVHATVVDRMLAQLWARLTGLVRKSILPLVVGGGSVFGMTQVSKPTDTAVGGPSAREHPGSGPLPEDLSSPAVIDAYEQCKADTRLAIDTCVEQAEACRAKDIPRPTSPPHKYEKSPTP
jgi:hypothetical protein